MAKPAKNTICLWYDGDAEDAARFYAKTFPDSSVGAVHRAPGDFPSGKKGDVLTVEFTVMGIPCLGLNGGPAFKHNEAFSFQVATADQAETDRYWNAIVGNGGQESACGWCKDKWGLSWQITPIALTKAITDPDPAAAKRAFDAMMTDEKDRHRRNRGGAPRLRLQSSKRACPSIEVVPRPRGMRHNLPLERTAAAVYFTCGRTTMRAPPRPLNGLTFGISKPQDENRHGGAFCRIPQRFCRNFHLRRI